MSKRIGGEGGLDSLQIYGGGGGIPSKKIESLWFSDLFREFKKGKLGRNGLIVGVSNALVLGTLTTAPRTFLFLTMIIFFRLFPILHNIQGCNLS